MSSQGIALGSVGSATKKEESTGVSASTATTAHPSALQRRGLVLGSGALGNEGRDASVTVDVVAGSKPTMTAPPPLHVSGGARSRTAGALRKSTAAHETLVGLLVAVLVVVAVSAVVLYQYWEVRELKLERQAALHKSHEWEREAKRAQSELEIRAHTIRETGAELSRRSAELEKLRIKIEREREEAQVLRTELEHAKKELLNNDEPNLEQLDRL